MIYRFKSQSEADVIMLGMYGDQMLTIIGRQRSTRGIITVEQIPASIAALEDAITTQEEAENFTHEHVPTKKAIDGDYVRLRARATPLIELLRKSAQAGKDVVWGV